jgi:hypothetical protein
MPSRDAEGRAVEIEKGGCGEKASSDPSDDRRPDLESGSTAIAKDNPIVVNAGAIGQINKIFDDTIAASEELRDNYERYLTNAGKAMSDVLGAIAPQAQKVFDKISLPEVDSSPANMMNLVGKIESSAADMAVGELMGSLGELCSIFLCQGLKVSATLGPEIAVGMIAGQAIGPAILAAAGGALATVVLEKGIEYTLRAVGAEEDVARSIGSAISVASCIFGLGITSPKLLKALRSRNLMKNADALRESGIKILSKSGVDEKVVRSIARKEMKAIEAKGFASLEEMEKHLFDLRKTKLVKRIEGLDFVQEESVRREAISNFLKNASPEESAKLKQFSELSRVHGDTVVLKRLREIPAIREGSPQFNLRKRLIEASAKYKDDLDAIRESGGATAEYSALLKKIRRKAKNPSTLHRATEAQEEAGANFAKALVPQHASEFKTLGAAEKNKIASQAGKAFDEFKQIHGRKQNIKLAIVGEGKKGTPPTAFMLNIPRIKKDLLGKTPLFRRITDAFEGDKSVLLFDNNLSVLRGIENLDEFDRVKSLVWHESMHDITFGNPKLAQETGLLVRQIKSELGSFGGFVDNYASKLYGNPFESINNESLSIAAESLSHPKLMKGFLDRGSEQMLNLLSVLENAT